MTSNWKQKTTHLLWTDLKTMSIMTFLWTMKTEFSFSFWEDSILFWWNVQQRILFLNEFGKCFNGYFKFRFKKSNLLKSLTMSFLFYFSCDVSRKNEWLCILSDQKLTRFCSLTVACSCVNGCWRTKPLYISFLLLFFDHNPHVYYAYRCNSLIHYPSSSCDFPFSWMLFGNWHVLKHSQYFGPKTMDTFVHEEASMMVPPYYDIIWINWIPFRPWKLLCSRREVKLYFPRTITPENGWLLFRSVLGHLNVSQKFVS